MGMNDEQRLFTRLPYYSLYFTRFEFNADLTRATQNVCIFTEKH